MSIDVNIVDESKSPGLSAEVTTDRALRVTPMPISLRDIVQSGDVSILTRQKLFIDTLKTDADAVSMVVDGSTTPVVFSLRAVENTLRTINKIRMVIHDTQMAISGSEGKRFGSIEAYGLTNGLDLYLLQGGVRTSLFVNPVKSIIQFMHYATDVINEPGALGSGTDLLVVTLEFNQTNIVLGTEDRLSLEIRDNLTTGNMEFFETYVFGTQEVVA